jgi:hypothetical protein
MRRVCAAVGSCIRVCFDVLVRRKLGAVSEKEAWIKCWVAVLTAAATQPAHMPVMICEVWKAHCDILRGCDVMVQLPAWRIVLCR